MRVLALVTDAYGGRGGIAQYNRDLFGALAQAEGVEIEILPRDIRETPRNLPAGVRQLAPRGGRAAYVATALRRVLALRPAVIFCGHINLAAPAAALARLTSARLVIQLHGIDAWERPSAAKRRAVEQADLVLCVSRYTRARVLEWASIPPERVAVLSNTVSEIFTPGDRHAARERFGLGAEKALLTVGRLDAGERYKGQDAVIECLPQLAQAVGDIVYLIAGDGDDRARLEALASSRGVAERVRFLGQVVSEALPDLYRAADLFVMPSTGEGFGIVFLEAMASGTPALGLEAAGAADALADGELGDAVEAADLCDAMARRLTAPSSDPGALHAAVQARFGREAFGRRARALFETEHG